jgi:hypothetical protein
MKRLLFVICLLALFACVPRHESAPEPAQPQFLPQYEELVVLYREFEGFRVEDIFLRHGFTANSPYADWLQRVRRLEEKPELAKRARLLAGLAVAWRQHGEESEVTKRFVSHFETGLKSQPPELAADGNATSPLGGKGFVGIVFTGDTQGVLTPQKIKNKEDVGGIARRTSLVQNIRNNHPGILVLDAGDTLASGFAGADRNNRTLIMSMNAMGYDAMGLNALDLQVGESQLKEMASLATFPMVCSNLEFSGPAWPWIKPYVLLERDGLRVAVLCLAAEAGQSVAPGVRIVPAQEALARILPEARAVSDCVVLLTQLGRAELATALAEGAGVDVVLGDGKESVDGRGWYLPTVSKGMGVGVVRMQRSGQGVISPASWISIQLGRHASVAHALKILEEGGLQEKVLAF